MTPSSAWLARLDINPQHLPLSPEHRDWLALCLGTLGAEYAKGEHASAVAFIIRGAE